MNLMNNSELNRAAKEYTQYNTIHMEFKTLQDNSLERHTHEVKVCLFRG